MNADVENFRTLLRTVDAALLTEEDRLAVTDLLREIYEAHQKIS